MARIDRQIHDRPLVPPHRRRATWIVVLGVGVASMVALLAVPAIADALPETPGSTGRILVCTSGVVDQGDVQTSSTLAVRVDDDPMIEIAEGCTVQ